MTRTTQQRESHSRRSARHAGAGRTFLVYFLLAAFDLATVSISLSLNHRIMRIYTESIIVNQNWADRQGIYANLGLLAARVNAPGNDVFESMAIDAEQQRLDDRFNEFIIRVEEARRDLRIELPSDEAGPLLALLDRAEEEMELEVVAANAIFRNLRLGNAQEAGERMANMDRRYNSARELLSELDARVRLLQRRNLDEQARAADALRRFEFVIAGLIVFMIVGVTLYGHFLVRQAQRNARERERYLNAIAENEARLEAVFRTANEGILTVRDGDRIESANPAAGKIFACPPESLVDRQIASILIDAHERVSFPCSDRDIQARRDTGQEFPLEVSVSDEVEASNSRLTTWIVRDISDRKQIEAELANYRGHLEQLVRDRTLELESTNEQLRISERLASIGTLAAGLGHDMKNLLFPMRCRLDVLESDSLPPEALQEIVEIRASLEYLQQLANGLRLLSLDPEDHVASEAFTRLETWWEEVGGLLTQSLPKHVSFETDFDQDLQLIPIASHRLTQAILNLLVNAGEAIADEGRVVFSVKQSEDRKTVAIAVSDSGHGMTEDVRRQALDPFFTTKKRGLSTGLGLSLVHAVASSAGGRVEIKSAPGRGATIRLEIPLTTVARESVGERSQSESDSLELRAVVSVEDPRLATFTCAVLTAASVEIERAATIDHETRASIWITDMKQDRLQNAQEFLSMSSRHQVVAIGRDDEGAWARIGSIRVGESGGAESLRSSLLRAIDAQGEVPS